MEHQRPARLRPGCQIATWQGYEGKRFTAWGLTEDQAAALTRAAQAAGIPQNQ